MKTYLILLIIFFHVNAFGQKEIQKGSYQFTTNELRQFSPQKSKDKNERKEIIKDSKITVLKFSKNDSLVYYRYWPYKDEDSEIANQYDSIFTMHYDYFTKLTKPLYSLYKGVTVGVYTIPYKITRY